MLLHLPRKVVPLVAIKLNLDDVVSIYQRLLQQVNEQADYELSRLKRQDNQTEEAFQDYIKRARDQAFKITITVTGRDGQSLTGEDATIFHSPNRPDKVASIYLTNATAYQAFAGVRPLNSFDLYLDFSKQPLLDWKNPVSAPTPNSSALTVQGDRDSWVATVSAAILGITSARRTRRAWIHQSFIYDVGLLFVALPFALYLCWKVSPLVQGHLAKLHPVVSAAAYIYVVLVTLFGYRLLFGYTKWAFPTLELADNQDPAIAHRAFWAAIILALIVNLIWELL